MTTTARDLNALLGSRICHDLISPLGAIGNGVELLSMSGISAAPEIALIAESVENANARIRFFRIAFGAASPGAHVSQSEVQSILRDCYKGNRISVDWDVDGGQPRGEIKLAMLLILCLEGALAWGGRIRVQRDSDSGAWSLTAAGDKLKVVPDLWQLLQDPDRPHELESADVHFGLAPHAAADIDRRIEAKIGDSGIRISF